MNIAAFRKILTGISGVPITAYGADGTVDAKATASIYARAAEAGIHNIVAAGNTGEFYALDADEVRLVLDSAVRGVDGRAPVTAAIGRSLKEAIVMAREARAAGATAVMAHQPVDPFAAPQSQIDYFRGLADGAPVPLVAYVRAEGFCVEDMLRLAAHPNIAGIKFATTDILLLSRAVAAADDTHALFVCGLAESWAPAFAAAGARGFTSGLINVAPHLSLAIHAALDSGNFAQARRLIEIIEPFERLRSKYRNGANVTVVKEATAIVTGLHVGPVRVPGLPRLEPQDRASLEAMLKTWPLADGDLSALA